MSSIPKYKTERKQVARFMRRLYKRGLTTTSGGNISLKLDDDLILITPSATDKGSMKWKEVGIVNIIGENKTPDLRLSIETGMHLAIYRKKKSVQAVVHAHPLFASSFTAMKYTIDTSLTAEARAILGEPLMVPYELMGTENLALAVSEKILKSDVLLLENHGIVTAGSSLLDAFGKTEVLENAARMTLIAELGKKKNPLTRSQILEIEKIFR